MNSEWKKGYEEGFIAGWQASRNCNTQNYQNFVPTTLFPTMIDQDINVLASSSFHTDTIVLDDQPNKFDFKI